MKLNSLTLKLAMAAALLSATDMTGEACSRVVYEGNDSLYIVGRSLDWRTPIPTNIYVYPRGMKKVGHDKPGAVSWTSRYGAVYAVSYDGGVTEGMNEKGLVVNGLFCKGTVYNNASTKDLPPMSLAMFPAWILDLNATTAEAVEMLKTQKFSISGADFDGGTTSTLHWGITDAQGKTAVVEFHNGDLNIYEADSVKVLTNDPTWPEMNAINDYWKAVGGTNMLPGTVRSSDRFVRAYFFDNHVKKTGDASTGVAVVRSIMANVSVPYDYTVESAPNVSMTQWRTYANLRDLYYYFDQASSLGIYYVDLKKCDLRKGASVMKITTSELTQKAGCANDELKRVAPFKPMY